MVKELCKYILGFGACWSDFCGEMKRYTNKWLFLKTCFSNIKKLLTLSIIEQFQNFLQQNDHHTRLYFSSYDHSLIPPNKFMGDL